MAASASFSSWGLLGFGCGTAIADDSFTWLRTYGMYQQAAMPLTMTVVHRTLSPTLLAMEDREQRRRNVVRSRIAQVSFMLGRNE